MADHQQQAEVGIDASSPNPLQRRDSLEKHLQTRPEEQDLKNRHILLDTTAAPALQAKQAELERQRITDNLKKVGIPVFTTLQAWCANLMNRDWRNGRRRRPSSTRTSSQTPMLHQQSKGSSETSSGACGRTHSTKRCNIGRTSRS